MIHSACRLFANGDDNLHQLPSPDHAEGHRLDRYREGEAVPSAPSLALWALALVINTLDRSRRFERPPWKRNRYLFTSRCRRTAKRWNASARNSCTVMRWLRCALDQGCGRVVVNSEVTRSWCYFRVGGDSSGMEGNGWPGDYWSSLCIKPSGRLLSRHKARKETGSQS